MLEFNFGIIVVNKVRIWQDNNILILDGEIKIRRSTKTKIGPQFNGNIVIDFMCISRVPNNITGVQFYPFVLFYLIYGFTKSLTFDVYGSLF